MSNCKDDDCSSCEQTAIIITEDEPSTKSCKTSSCCSTKSSSTKCGCGTCSSTPYNSIPYYRAVNMCPSNSGNSSVVNIVSTVRSTQSFSMPACGKKIKIVFDVAGDVPIGAWLWADGIGFLEVTAYNAACGEIEVTNPCPTNCLDQADPGSPITQCTTFIITSPQCASESGAGPSNLYPYLAADFTAQDVGDCLNITVTNVNGLSVSKDVTINGSIYRVGAILDATTIQICNDGAGATPGTPVYARDSSGNLDVPIVLIDSNPCSNSAVVSGSVLACNAGVTQPLTGTQDGQFLVLTNPTTGEAEYQTVNIEQLVCSPLFIDLVLDHTLPGGYSYPIQVEDGTDFTVSNYIEITSASVTYQFLITGKIGNLLAGQLITTIAAIVNIPAGTNVCEQSCCVQLDTRVTALEESLQPASVVYIDYVIDSAILDIDVTAGNYITRAATDLTINVTNTNLTRDMNFLVNIVGRGGLNLSDETDVQIELDINVDSAGWTKVGEYRFGLLTPGDQVVNSTLIAYMNIMPNVPPTVTRVLEIRSRLLVYANPSNTSKWDNDSIKVDIIGVII